MATPHKRLPRSSLSTRESHLEPNSSTLNLSPVFNNRRILGLRKSSAPTPGSSKSYTQPNQTFSPLPSIRRPGVNGNGRHDADMDDSVVQEDHAEEEEEEEENIIDRLRLSRNDAMQQHLYSTASFWGSKAYEMTRDPNDAFWLAQIYFLTHQHARAEKILSTPKAEPTFRSGKGKEPESNSAQPLVRLTDISIACRYLAAQCMVRQGKWTEALDLLGESNPFSTKQKQTNGAAEKPFHGGIKFEASMCHLRGLIHLHLNSSQKAKECFLEALTLDVKCYESFESLVDGNMLMVDEEWEFIQGLKYAEQTEEDAEFIRMAYTVRLKKYKNHDESALCRKKLTDDYGLSEDPDVLFGLADELFTGLRWKDCFAVTSSILALHEGHGPTLPLHLACMYQLPSLHSRLFLLAHELVERAPDVAVSWYAVGLWYYASKRWDESRRYFGKAVLLDPRFGPAWVAFAHAYALEGEHDQSITAYSTAQRHFQGTHLPLLFIGMQHLQLNNFAVSREHLDAAWAMCTVDPLLANEVGVACYWSDEFEDAIKYFEIALQLVKSIQGVETAWTHTYTNLGHALRKTKRFKEAKEAYTKAIDLDPKLAAAHLGLGFVLSAMGEREAAVERLHEGLARSPADPLGAELLRTALEDSASSIKLASSPGTFTFPGLNPEIAATFDREAAEEDIHAMAMGTSQGRQGETSMMSMEQSEDVSMDESSRA